MTAPERLSSAARTFGPHPVLALGVPLVLALLTRLPALGRPTGLVFDELYYVPDAADLLARGVEGGRPVQPPLGKWVIAVGLKVIGFTAWGWRLLPLLAGLLVVALTYGAARKLRLDTLSAGMAAGVVALDGISIVSSRLALLDVFVAVLTVAALCVIPSVLLGRSWAPTLLGLWSGLAIAVKWTAAFALPLAVFLGAWGVRERRPWAWIQGALTVLGVAGGVYVVTWAGWFAHPERSAAYVSACAEGRCSTSVGAEARLFIDEHNRILRFQRSLVPQNTQTAKAWTWAVQTQPAELYRLRCPAGITAGPCSGEMAGKERRIVAGSNPVLWIGLTVGLVVALVIAARQRAMGPFMVGAWAVALWLPLLASWRDGYSFSAAPIVPPLAIAAVWALSRLSERWRRRLFVVVAFVAVLWLVVAWPLLSAQPVAHDVADRLARFAWWW